MAEGWIGKSISIKCIEPAGTIFQGVIKAVTPDIITIVRGFRNGVPLRKPETEVKIASVNIASLELVAEGLSKTTTTTTTKPTQPPSQEQRGGQEKAQPAVQEYDNSNKRFFPTVVPPSPGRSRPAASTMPPVVNQQQSFGAPSTSGRNSGKHVRRFQNANSKSETFGTPVDDPEMNVDFDFEHNLALFDKQAVWEKFNQMDGRKSDQTTGTVPRQQSQHQSQPKYRHDENILQSAPTQYRQIEVDYNSSREYVSDDGLIVPSIPLIVRNRVQTAAEAMGLTWERQIDILSRGVCDTALQLLGGARRLKPNNKHQWPNIVVVCEEPYNERKSEIGICTGRMMATHGLKVVVYVRQLTGLSRMSYELDLFKATGNDFTEEIAELPRCCDLIIISSRMSQLSPDITKWIMERRTPVLAIDPPVGGFVRIQAKCSILPMLPLDDINTTACGKLYLVNLSIPDKFFHDAGIKYSSPFGHKHVIPIHTCD